MDDAWAIAERVRSREVSARELAQDALSRLPELDRDVGSVWLVTDELALEQADRVDAAVAVGDDPGELAGVTVGWKDLIDTAGIRTTYGSAIWRDHVPDRDADCVERLAAAGGVTIAKLATHELAWGTTTDNPWFGTLPQPARHQPHARRLERRLRRRRGRRHRRRRAGDGHRRLDPLPGLGAAASSA